MTAPRRIILAAGAAAVVAAVAGAVAWRRWSAPAPYLLHGVVETQEINLGSKVGGRVAKVFVADGDRVEADAPLVEFDVDEWKAQRLQVDARLAQAQASLTRLEAGARPEERRMADAEVAVAQARFDRMKNGFRPEEVEMSQADLDSALAAERLAQADFERIEPLLSTRSATPAEFDAAKSANDRARKGVAALRARLAMMKAGNRREDVDEAQAMLHKAVASRDLVYAGPRREDIEVARRQVAEAKGTLAEVDVRLKEETIRAPEACVVEVLGVRAGDVVAANQPAVRVLRTADLWVKVFVPETELPRIALGDRVEVTTDVARATFAGEVSSIAAVSEFTPRNVQTVEGRRAQLFGIKIRIDDPKGVFKSGMAAHIRWPDRTPPPAIPGSAPKAAPASL